MATIIYNLTINNWGRIGRLVKDEKKRPHQFKIWCKSPFQIFATAPFSWHLDCDELKNCYHSKKPISHRISLSDIIGSLGKKQFFLLSSFFLAPSRQEDSQSVHFVFFHFSSCRHLRWKNKWIDCKSCGSWDYPFARRFALSMNTDHFNWD
jgi:hypothetical protein